MKNKPKKIVVLECILHTLALIAIGLLIYTCFFVQSIVPKVVSIVINIMTLLQWTAFNISIKNKYSE